jgi:hypothetical protein
VIPWAVSAAALGKYLSTSTRENSDIRHGDGETATRGDGVLLNGVRAIAIAGKQDCGAEGMEQAMALSLRESLHLVSDPENLDASVEEVFRMMLGVECERATGPAFEMNIEPESVTAVVDLAAC